MSRVFIPTLIALLLSGCSTYPVEEWADHYFDRLNQGRIDGQPAADEATQKKTW